MPNALITSSMITNETMRIIHNESAFLGNINTEYKKEFAKEGGKAGSTVNVRRPVQFTVRSGATINIQDVNETTVPVTISPEFGVDFAFSDFDLTMTIDKFADRYLKAAGTRMAAELDMRIGALYASVNNFSGTPGTPAATVQAPLDAAVLLDNYACPRDGRRTLAISPQVNAKLVGGMSGGFNNQQILGDQNKRGLMDTYLGMAFQMSQNVPFHTVGVLGGTPTVNGASQGLINAGATDSPYAATTSLLTQAWTAGVATRLKKGDVITLAGVFAVNLETKGVLPNLAQFVVTADAASDGAGALTAVLSPAIIAGGAYQNVSARPASGAAITVLTGASNTTYQQNLLFHRDAFTLVTCDMEVPKGMDMASKSEYDGVSVRFIRGYDITNNRRVCRFDMLAGFAAIRPEWAVRLTS